MALEELETNLEDILLEEDPHWDKEHFVVDSIEKAAWAAKKFIEAQHRVNERLDQNLKFKEKIDKWLERVNRDDLNTMEYMKSVLQPYAEEVVNNQKRSKNLKLPEVIVQFRNTPERLEIENEELSLNFCESNYPTTIEIKKLLVKKELKSLVDKGVVIPGVTLLPGVKRMSIKSSDY